MTRPTSSGEISTLQDEFWPVNVNNCPILPESSIRFQNPGLLKHHPKDWIVSGRILDIWLLNKEHLGENNKGGLLVLLNLYCNTSDFPFYFQELSNESCFSKF